MLEAPPPALTVTQLGSFMGPEAVSGSANTTGTLRILFWHEHFVVVDKPSGWLFHKCAAWMQKENKDTPIFTDALERQIGQRVFPTSSELSSP